MLVVVANAFEEKWIKAAYESHLFLSTQRLSK
jgi:hypothetical protein